MMEEFEGKEEESTTLDVDLTPEEENLEQDNNYSDDYEESYEELSEEKLNLISDTAIESLQKILKYFDVKDVEIDEYEGEDQEIILDITADNSGVLIGRYGHTLEALQFLISVITFKKLKFKHRVSIDVESYKNRQREKIEHIAIRTAERALRQGMEVKMKPMNAYERRLIHLTLRDDVRVKTFSIGYGSKRRVVVAPI